MEKYPNVLMCRRESDRKYPEALHIFTVKTPLIVNKSIHTRQLYTHVHRSPNDCVVGVGERGEASRGSGPREHAEVERLLGQLVVGWVVGSWH